MKIYHISQSEITMMANVAHVVVANTDNEVIELAKLSSQYEGEILNVWDSAQIEIIGEYSGLETEPFILMTDYREDE